MDVYVVDFVIWLSVGLEFASCQIERDVKVIHGFSVVLCGDFKLVFFE